MSADPTRAWQPAELLFDDVIWVHEAQKDHYDFVLKMQERGVEVLELLGCGLGLTREPGQNPLKDVGLLGDDALAVGREGCEFLVGLL